MKERARRRTKAEMEAIRNPPKTTQNDSEEWNEEEFKCALCKKPQEELTFFGLGHTVEATNDKKGYCEKCYAIKEKEYGTPVKYD